MIVDQKGAQESINNPFFKSITPLGDNYYEVKLRQRCVTLDLPIQIGLFVYGYAKLRLLKFYYEFVDYYIDRRDFEVVTCDTDSLYLALSAESLEDVIKPEKRDHFNAHRDLWLPTQHCKRHKQVPSPAERAVGLSPCCQDAHRYQTREPGLWKLEAKADKILALAPKTYICVGGDFCKVSSKGVQKKINPLTFDNFHKVLITKQPHQILNRGFRLDAQYIMRNYLQPKKGLSYLYIKRKVLADGVSTEPLDL